MPLTLNRTYPTISQIEMSNDLDMYQIKTNDNQYFYMDSTEEGDYCIVEKVWGGTDDTQEYSHSLAELREQFVKYLIPDDLMITGYGKFSGRKYWQLPTPIKNQVIRALSKCGGKG